MNTTLSPSYAATEEEQFGHRLAARLSEGNVDLPHDIGERLRVARLHAIAHRKMVPQFRTAPLTQSNGATQTLRAGWWTRIGSVVPLIALVAGLMAISVMQEDNRADELAEVDSALLTDDLPPAAYTDPGFAQFLKAGDTAPAR